MRKEEEAKASEKKREKGKVKKIKVAKKPRTVPAVQDNPDVVAEIPVDEMPSEARDVELVYEFSENDDDIDDDKKNETQYEEPEVNNNASKPADSDECILPVNEFAAS